MVHISTFRVSMGTHQQTFPLAVDKFYEITVLDMTQQEFDRQMERAQKASYIKGAVAIAVRLCVTHPALAMDWYERQPKAVQD